MRIFVAIPCYDGKLPTETVKSLLDEQIAAIAGGDELRTMFLPGCSLITMARNHLAQTFLESDCDRLMFVDADISWPMGELVKVAKRKQDVVGGAYRYKREKESYPVGWIKTDNGIWADDGLVEVEFMPTGFLAINKSVLMRLKEADPTRNYSHDGKSQHCWFENPFVDGKFCGEDAWFCHQWRKLGGKVYLDHTVTLTHHNGPQAFTGNAGEWLQRGEWKNV